MNPREKAVFQAKQTMRLGSEDPVCVRCGESNPLRLVLPNGHHLTGKQRDPELQTILCASCHQELHLLAPLRGATFGQRERHIPARTAGRLRALGLFFDIVAEHLQAHDRSADGHE